jgi:hypothetical protein
LGGARALRSILGIARAAGAAGVGRTRVGWVERQRRPNTTARRPGEGWCL